MVSIDQNYVLGWVYERQVNGIETRWRDFEEEFGPWDGSTASKKCAKQTFVNYKKQLEATGRLTKRLSASSGRPVYFIPEKFAREARFAGKLSRIIRVAESDSLEKAIQEMFKDVMPKIVSALLDQVKSYAIKKGYEDFAKEIDRDFKPRKIKLTFR